MTDNWMIEEVTVVQGVRHVVVTTADGLVRARSEQTTKDEADLIGATAAGLHSLGQALARRFGPGEKADSRHVMVEIDGGFLFVRRAANGSNLAVLADPMVDPQLIAQQMSTQIAKIGQRNLAVPARRPASGPPA